MVTGPRGFPVRVCRSVLAVCSWAWEARLSLLDLLRAVPCWALEPQTPRSTSRSGVSPLAGLVVWGVARGVRGCPLMWGNELCWEVCRARRGSGQKVPGSACPEPRGPGGRQPHQRVPAVQRRSQDSTRAVGTGSRPCHLKISQGTLHK